MENQWLPLEQLLMTRLSQVQDIFEQALSKHPESRNNFVVQICHGDKALTTKVLALLDADKKSERFLSDLLHKAYPSLEITTVAPHSKLGHYRLCELIGEGGMGIVYRAWDEKLQRNVAVKILPSLRAGNPNDKERFLQEAKAAAQLNHHNVCEVFEINETDDGQLYIITAFCPGEDLAKNSKQIH